MKVAVTATGVDLNAPVDPRFGRAQYFIIVDLETMEFEAIPNPNINAMGGAGIQSAQLLGNKGVGAVITGQVGPNAFQTLSAIGVPIYQAMGGTVVQAVEAFKAGRLLAIGQPGPSHVGMGMGRGVGAGRGMGRGRGVGFAPGPGPVGPASTTASYQGHPQQMSKEQEIQILKTQAETIGKQLEEINRRLQELEKEKKSEGK